MSTHTFRIHGPRGIIERASITIVEAVRERTRTNADRVSVTAIMSRQVVCALPDLPLAALIEVMVREHLGCLPIVDEHGHPLGMVTKFDIVEQLIAPAQHALPTAADVMMPLAITLDRNATVAHAAAIMASEGMHHVMIVDDRRLVGVVSTLDVTRWLAHENAGVA